MPFKVNNKAIENYSHTLTEKIVFNSFNSQEFITGKEINSLTESSQINTLILKKLFDKWNEEINRFKSPFFDFEDSDVIEALNTFKNKLSFHIKMDKNTFEPILEEAVKDTFSLAFEPIEAVKRIFLNDLNNFKNNLKFLKIHPELADVLMSLENPTEEEINSIVDNWDKYEINATELLNQTSKFHVGSIDDFLLEEPMENLSDPAPVIKQVPLITEEKKSLNDLFQSEQNEKNLAQKLQGTKKLDSLHSGININQRFVFMKELFGGDANIYNATLDRLDLAGDYSKAELIISEEAYNKFDWSSKEETVSEFMTILSRRY